MWHLSFIYDFRPSTLSNHVAPQSNTMLQPSNLWPTIYASTIFGSPLLSMSPAITIHGPTMTTAHNYAHKSLGIHEAASLEMLQFVVLLLLLSWAIKLVVHQFDLMYHGCTHHYQQ